MTACLCDQTAGLEEEEENLPWTGKWIDQSHVWLLLTLIENRKLKEKFYACVSDVEFEIRENGCFSEWVMKEPQIFQCLLKKIEMWWKTILED